MFLHKTVLSALCLMLTTRLQCFPPSHAFATLVPEIPVSFESFCISEKCLFRGFSLECYWTTCTAYHANFPMLMFSVCFDWFCFCYPGATIINCHKLRVFGATEAYLSRFWRRRFCDTHITKEMRPLQLASSGLQSGDILDIRDKEVHILKRRHQQRFEKPWTQ